MSGGRARPGSTRRQRRSGIRRSASRLTGAGAHEAVPREADPAARPAGSRGMRAGRPATGRAGAREAGPFRDAALRRLAGCAKLGIRAPEASARGSDREKFRRELCRPGGSLAPKGEVSSQRPRGRMPRPFVPMRGGRRVPGEAAPGDAAPGDAAAARRGAAMRFGAPAAMRAGGGPRSGTGCPREGPGRRAGIAAAGRAGGRSAGARRRSGRQPPPPPAAGGRPGRCSGTGEAGIARRRGPPEFAAACGGRKPRRPPDAGSPEAPPGAFSARKDAEAIEKNSPRRTGEDAS